MHRLLVLNHGDPNTIYNMFPLAISLKLFIALLLVIAVFLEAFLLLGCLDTTSAYSSVYLTSYLFNSTSGLSAKINQTESTGGEDSAGESIGGEGLKKILGRSTKELGSGATSAFRISVKVGYLSACVDINSNITCTTYANLEPLEAISELEVDKTSLNLVLLSKAFSEICHLRLLMALIIISMMLLILLFYSSIPLIPGKIAAIRACLLLAIINTLLWGLGSMLQDEAVKTSRAMVPVALMGLALLKVGTRARAMAWTSFAFMVVTAFGTAYLSVVDMFRGRFRTGKGNGM